MDKLVYGIPLYLVLPVLLVIAIILLVVMVKAFNEGREISFWPPKIGPRPGNKEPDKRQGEVAEPPKTISEIKGTSPDLAKGTALMNYRPESKHHHRELTENKLGAFEDFDVDAIRTLEVISGTEHSVIERCLVKGSQYVLKRTKAAVCQYDTLKKLVGQRFVGHEGSMSATIATPISVWAKHDYVWELHPFHEGITLQELIKTNRCRVLGSVLGSIHNALVDAISALHKEKILHRDIAPSNVFITPSGNLIILDCSFACSEGLSQVAVGNSAYTAPEQRLGQATVKSDWHSIAGTIYFLANGFPPDRNDETRFKEGLLRIATGEYRPPFNFKPVNQGLLGLKTSVPKLFESMLDPNMSCRPADYWEIALQEDTVVTDGFSPVLGILNMGKFGFLITQLHEHQVLGRDSVSDFLADAFRCNAIESAELQTYATEIMETCR
jgi:serine/threonine protein kinase